MAQAAVNEAQAEHWNGDDGEHWARHHDRYDAMLRPFGAYALDAAGLEPGQAVLDVGCGCGATTIAAATEVRPSGRAVGVDLSGPMLERARQQAAEAGVDNVTFDQADAQTHPFDPESFDVAISRFGIMFFEDPTAAFANLARALRGGGRLAFVCWQDLAENDWMLVPATAALAHVPMPDLGPPGAPGPFAFAEPDRVRRILADAGFADVALDGIRQPLTVAGGGTVEEAVEFLRQGSLGRTLLEGAEPAAAERAVAAVADVLADHMGDGGIQLGGTAWLVTARR